MASALFNLTHSAQKPFFLTYPPHPFTFSSPLRSQPIILSNKPSQWISPPCSKKAFSINWGSIRRHAVSFLAPFASQSDPKSRFCCKLVRTVHKKIKRFFFGIRNPFVDYDHTPVKHARAHRCKHNWNKWSLGPLFSNLDVFPISIFFLPIFLHHGRLLSFLVRADWPRSFRTDFLT